MKKRIAITIVVATALSALVVFGKKKIRAKVEIVDSSSSDE